MVPLGVFDRCPPGPQSTLRTALRRAGPESPEHAHTFGGHCLLQHTSEAWKAERGNESQRKSQTQMFDK